MYPVIANPQRYDDALLLPYQGNVSANLLRSGIE
jgi:hypothetical protein